MAFNPSSPVTGGAQTGLTSPTYTIASDTAPDANGKQWAVTALGGTQTSVTIHSVSSPFTVTGWRPKSFKVLGTPDPNTGVYYRVGKNTWSFIVRKGVTPAANQSPQVMTARVDIAVPAGADSYDAANVRACLSLLIGAINNQSAGIGDTAVTGIL
jgi:hypothetical protein